MSMKKLTIYYDGACYLCSAEIDQYRKVDRDGKINFVSIADPAFDVVKEGLDAKRVQREMHARLPNGELKTGVDAFIAIWNVFPKYHFLAVVASKPYIKPVLKVFYTTFASYIRPYLPKKKGVCENGTCSTR